MFPFYLGKRKCSFRRMRLNNWGEMSRKTPLGRFNRSAVALDRYIVKVWLESSTGLSQAYVTQGTGQSDSRVLSQ